MSQFSGISLLAPRATTMVTLQFTFEGVSDVTALEITLKIVEFLRILMRASESAFESYNSDRLLHFAYLIFSRVSGPKALKTCVRFPIFNFKEKLQNIFEVG